MCSIRHPAQMWDRDSIVVAVETIELAGQVLPFSYSQQLVQNRQIISSMFMQVAWARQGATAATRAELEGAVKMVNTTRRLTVADLHEGVKPETMFRLVEKMVRVASKRDTLVVTHSVNPGLTALLAAVENWLHVDLPPIAVVSTGPLEFARRTRQQPLPGESQPEFYRRMQVLMNDVPRLAVCWGEQEWHDLPVQPEDRLFSVFATTMIYFHHFGGRLLPGFGSSARA